jgi:hypothetical protein
MDVPVVISPFVTREHKYTMGARGNQQCNSHKSTTINSYDGMYLKIAMFLLI